jgi:DNA repair protein RadC
MDDFILKRVAVRLVEEQPLCSNEPMDCPEAAIRVMNSFLKDMDREIFCIVNLQEDLRPINMETVSVGVLNGALVHPREVMKSAILSNAASIMLVHNHPSGHLVPSSEDIAVTERLQDAGQIIGIKVVDHIITGRERGRYFSFQESEMLRDSPSQLDLDFAAEY